MIVRILLVLALVAMSDRIEASDARAAFDAFARGLSTLEGRFEQRVADANGNPLETSTGRIAVRAPRQFRWEYEAPFPQLIVADGDNVWIFDPDLDQVTVRAQALEEARSPLTVLTDLSQLDEDYRVSEQPDADGLRWLRLEPKSPEAPFRHCDLGFDGEGLARMVLVDQLGQRNEIAFTGWRRNAPLDAALFRFEPPAGVDVVGEPARTATVTPIPDE
jgi:outer membrane lipoprotein carrier protein